MVIDFCFFENRDLRLRLSKKIFFQKKTTNFFPIFHFFPAELWGVNDHVLNLFQQGLYGPPGWVGGECFWHRNRQIDIEKCIFDVVCGHFFDKNLAKKCKSRIKKHHFYVHTPFFPANLLKNDTFFSLFEKFFLRLCLQDFKILIFKNFVKFSA